MAHKKGMGSSKNGRDSNAKRLGVKVSDGQSILSGGIILKQSQIILLVEMNLNSLIQKTRSKK